MGSKKGELIVGLDIGTTKVVTVVGELLENGQIEIVGVGRAWCNGLRRGVVVDIDSTVRSIRESVLQAEQMAGCKIDSVFAGVAGAHVKAFNSHGVVGIKGGTVRAEDIENVLASARAAAIPTDRQVLHVVPQEYVIDDQDGIQSPLGIHGVRLEARVHIVTALTSAAQNVVNCAELAGLKVTKLVLEPLASAEAVLTEEERELGVCIVDIGGGTTDIAVFGKNALLHTAVIPQGGDHITNDIVVGLRTPPNEAERIKKEHGCALSSLVPKDELIDVPSVGDRPPRQMARRIVCDIIEPRLDEIFRLVASQIQESGVEDQLTSGVVVTGGASRVSGLEEMLEELLGVLVRRGEPRGFTGAVDLTKGPEYATALGLLIHGAKIDQELFYLGHKHKTWWDRLRSSIDGVF